MANVILTDRLCEKRVAKRTKIYDRKCPGLYVSITTAGAATFSIKFTDATVGKQRTGFLGIYNPETFTVDHARSAAWGLKGKGGHAAVRTLQQHKAVADKLGKTVSELIMAYIDHIKTPVLKRDGEMRALKESWEGMEANLKRSLEVAYGSRLATEITNDDIATLMNDIREGKYGSRGVTRVSSARNMRNATSAMYKWAKQAGNKFVTSNPCADLPPLPEEPARERVLSEDEIRTLWFGLDREDLPFDRRIRLALKLELATMLRGGELRPMHKSWLNREHGTVDIPAKWVKKRRVINQPLNIIAQEIIKEAMGNNEFVFAGRAGNEPLGRQSMSGALAGSARKRPNGRIDTSPGICELLGMKPFTPHDLRRTAATMLGELENVSDYGISLCLDHQNNKDRDGKTLPAITKKVYNKATQKAVNEKRKVLDAWAIELRRVLDGKPANEQHRAPVVWLLAA